jgi:hypothetical protein
MGMPPPYSSTGPPSYHNPQQVFQPISQPGGAANAYYPVAQMHSGQSGPHGFYQTQPGQDFQNSQQPQIQQGGSYAPSANMPGGAYQPGAYQTAPPVAMNQQHFNQHPQQHGFQPIPQQQQQQQANYYAGPVQHLPLAGQEAQAVTQLQNPVAEEQPLISFD